MQRKEALKHIALILGATLSSGTLAVLNSGCRMSADRQPGFFTPAEHQFFEAFAATLIPKTETAGALEAAVPEFIVNMLEDCYSARVRRSVRQFIAALDESAGTKFMILTADCKEGLLTDIEAGKSWLSHQHKETLTVLKELGLLGYFTSSECAGELCPWIPVPGKYVATLTLKKDQRAWMY